MDHVLPSKNTLKFRSLGSQRVAVESATNSCLRIERRDGCHVKGKASKNELTFLKCSSFYDVAEYL